MWGPAGSRFSLASMAGSRRSGTKSNPLLILSRYLICCEGVETSECRIYGTVLRQSLGLVVFQSHLSLILFAHGFYFVFFWWLFVVFFLSVLQRVEIPQLISQTQNDFDKTPALPVICVFVFSAASEQSHHRLHEPVQQ